MARNPSTIGAASAAMPVMAYALANKFAPTTHVATRVYLYFDLLNYCLDFYELIFVTIRLFRDGSSRGKPPIM